MVISPHFACKLKGILDLEYLLKVDVSNICYQLVYATYQKTQQNGLILFSCLIQCICLVYFDLKKKPKTTRGKFTE